jgi:hypothetical protein
MGRISLGTGGNGRNIHGRAEKARVLATVSLNNGKKPEFAKMAVTGDISGGTLAGFVEQAIWEAQP